MNEIINEIEVMDEEFMDEEQTTFNEDGLDELVEDGGVENVYDENE